jgi:hypothetical protein
MAKIHETLSKFEFVKVLRQYLTQFCCTFRPILSFADNFSMRMRYPKETAKETSKIKPLKKR